ncbi:MAG: hypothetical protein FIA99_09405 [Ruminiclostridium sp.]|nr:hypothetical protein [Ruminiclostridium sp.]
MSKIYSFIIIIPLIAMLLFKGVFFYEYDTKQRYIKDLADSTAYIVKITGVLAQDEYSRLKTNLNKYAIFDDSSIILKKGIYSNGNITASEPYLPGTRLNKGDAFMIYVRSTNVSNYSRVENGGVSADDSKNLHFMAKAVCRIEYLD